jgi:hypothetical protein
VRPILSLSLIALPLVFMGGTQTLAQTACKPTIAFSEAHYAPMKLPRLERTWTVAFTVDASRCATDSGSFLIRFTVWKENAPDRVCRDLQMGSGPERYLQGSLG